jgi:hypothetical protein
LKPKDEIYDFVRDYIFDNASRKWSYNIVARRKKETPQLLSFLVDKIAAKIKIILDSFPDCKFSSGKYFAEK